MSDNDAENVAVVVRILRELGPRAALLGSMKLCSLYFNIAAEVLGEEEVRRRRDALMAVDTTEATESADQEGVKP